LIFEILRGLKPIRGEIRREFEIQVVNEKRGSINFINPRFFVFCLLENFKETKIYRNIFTKSSSISLNGVKYWRNVFPLYPENKK
jgi:uncharacterized protein YjaG (DUF416 family)